MKKKQAIFTLVACSIAALLLTGVLVIGLQSDSFGIGALREENNHVHSEDGWHRYEYFWDPAETEVNALNVEWINGQVDLKVGKSDKIKITESSQRALKESEKLRLSSSGGELKIKWKDSLFHFSLFENSHKHLTVEVPREVAESLELLKCSTSPGDISAAGFTVEELELSTVSGEMDLQKLRGESGVISTTSGGVKGEGLTFSEKLQVNSTSGEMSFSKVTAQELSLNTVSGDISFQGDAGQIDANTVSAEVTCDLSACPEEADLDSVSGDLTLLLPENSGFQAEFDSVSGDFSSDFPVTESAGRMVYGTGGARLSFNTTSGGARVKKR